MYRNKLVCFLCFLGFGFSIYSQDSSSNQADNKAKLQEITGNAGQDIVREKLETKRRELEDGQIKLEADQKELETKRQELEEDQEKLEADQTKLKEDLTKFQNMQKLDNQIRNLEIQKLNLEIQNLRLDIDGKNVELAAKKQKLDERETELNIEKQKLDKRETELNVEKQKLDKREKELNVEKYNLDERKTELNIEKYNLDEREERLNTKEAELNIEKQKLNERETELNVKPAKGSSPSAIFASLTWNPMIADGYPSNLFSQFEPIGFGIHLAFLWLPGTFKVGLGAQFGYHYTLGLYHEFFTRMQASIFTLEALAHAQWKLHERFMINVYGGGGAAFFADVFINNSKYETKRSKVFGSLMGGFSAHFFPATERFFFEFGMNSRIWVLIKAEDHYTALEPYLGIGLRF